MTYRIVTTDRTASHGVWHDHRQVAHHGIDADTRHAAVAVAVRRRYRLGQDATVRVYAEAYGTAYAGTYAVYLPDAEMSAWYGVWVDMTPTPTDPNGHALADADAEVSVGMCVWWTDPDDGICSGWYRVASVDGDTAWLVNAEGTEAHVPLAEVSA